jgi:uncharacterized protein YecT (DUF1311 family)
MSTVFISYRRQTAAGEARALFNDLVARLGQNAVFMDVDSISLGRDFRSELHKTLAACDLMLVIIDKDWAAATDESGRVRLENASDYVRMEIEAALKRDIAVTPVLVKGARMPAAEELPTEIRDLAYRNGFELSHNRWESDVGELMRRLNFDVPEQGGQVETDRRPIAPVETGGGSLPAGAKPRVDRGPAPPKARQPSRQVLVIAGVLCVVCLGGVAAWLGNQKPEPDGPQAPAAQTLLAKDVGDNQSKRELTLNPAPQPGPRDDETMRELPPPPKPEPISASPGFDCKTNRAPVEVEICRSVRLSSLDREMNDLYRTLRRRLNKDQLTKLGDEQTAWLEHQRADCMRSERSEPCLVKVYESRISQLKSQ